MVVEAKLLSIDETVRRVEERLRSGWILGLGDVWCWAAVEELVYPPGSGENSFFETLIIPAAPLRVIYLMKKTEKLMRLLGYRTIDRVVAVVAYRIDERKCAFGLSEYGSESEREELIRKLINEIRA